MHYMVLVGGPESKRPLGILKWIFKKWDGEVWTSLIWLRDMDR
jgi:hypothetical protein